MKRKSDKNNVTHKQSGNKRVYIKPQLICYGDVRDITLGGSPGGGDSGSPTTRRRR